MLALVSALCICIVFLLDGVARYLFVPLAEAVVFACWPLTSYPGRWYRLWRCICSRAKVIDRNRETCLVSYGAHSSVRRIPFPELTPLCVLALYFDETWLEGDAVGNSHDQLSFQQSNRC
jgi:hypothetical protein